MPNIDVSTPADSHKISVEPWENNKLRFTIRTNDPGGADKILAWVTLTPDRTRIFQRMIDRALGDQLPVIQKVKRSRLCDRLHARVNAYHRKVVDALRRIVAR